MTPTDTSGDGTARTPQVRARGSALESELFRLSVSTATAVGFAVALFWSRAARSGALMADSGWDAVVGSLVTTVMVPAMLVAWIVQGWVYLALSWRAHSRMSSARLLEYAGAQHARRRWWWSFLGAGSAENWTLSGGLLATLLVILGARVGYFDGSAPPMVVGLGAVTTAWVVMVYSFALRYAEVYARGDLEIPFTTRPTLRDFVTISVLASTLFDRIAVPRTSQAAGAFRSHALLAWVVNTILVAMCVTILFGGLIT